MGRGSPRCGSRKKRWGVVALGVVAGKETEINRAHKTHNPKSRCGNLSNTYTKPPKSPLHLSTDSCLQSDNGVSTSNSPPARNIVTICPDYYIKTCISKYQNTTEFFFTQVWKTKMLHLQKHSNKSIPYFCKHTHDH